MTLCMTEDTKWLFSTFVEPLVTLIAVYVAYRYAIRQMKKETHIQIEREKYKRTMDALQDCWKLLAFMTTTENEKSILTWQQNPDQTKTYFLNKANAQGFIDGLASFFYGTGLGLYLPQNIRPLLFEYRGVLYGFLLKESNNPSPKIVVNNPEMITKMTSIYDDLVKKLREELNTQDPEMPKN
jgi:hypothetical protein